MFSVTMIEKVVAMSVKFTVSCPALMFWIKQVLIKANRHTMNCCSLFNYSILDGVTDTKEDCTKGSRIFELYLRWKIKGNGIECNNGFVLPKSCLYAHFSLPKTNDVENSPGFLWCNTIYTLLVHFIYQLRNHDV